MNARISVTISRYSTKSPSANPAQKLLHHVFPQKSAFTVTWYGGEPLLARDVIGKLTKEFKRICESKESKYYAGIITNGYLLSKENLDFLIDCGVTFAQVTVDGPEEIHDKRRCLKSGGPTYRRIMENLSNIEEGSPFRVSIRVNIDKRNSGSILPLLEDFKAKGFHNHKNIFVYFSQVVHYANSCPDIASQCMVTQEFSEFMVEAYMIALDKGFNIGMYPKLNIGLCGAISINSAVIEPNATFQTCWNTVGQDDLKSGVLTESGIRFDSNYTKWVGWSPFSKECENCPVLPICMGGCPYKRLYFSKIDNPENNTCIWWKYNLKPMLKVACAAMSRHQISVCKD